MIRKKITYVNEEGFEFAFEPIENTLKIKKIERELCSICKTELEHIEIKKENVFGCPKCKKEIERKKSIKEKSFEVRYLTRDNNCLSPEEQNDNNLFLVGYHRDFTVDRGQRELVKIFKKEDFKKENGYNGRVYEDGYGWKSYAKAKKEGLVDKEVKRGKYVAGISKDLAIVIANGGKYEDNSICDEAKEYIKKYRIFGLEAYIHSGISLALSQEGNFPDRQWDVSQLGLVFVSKEETKNRNNAKKLALGLIADWNKYLSGDVYCIVKEIYNKDKERIDYDNCGGYYGYDYALKDLKRN
jgi:predicted RNA-binding Zn-ribbon protein involved in translation (DUF1610 family)